MTFDELYRSLLRRVVQGQALPEKMPQADPKHLDSLLHPGNYAPVWALHNCTDCAQDEPSCCAACLFNAIERRTDGTIVIDPQRCSGCAACLNACSSGTLAASQDVLPALYDIKHAKGPVYALIAPSFNGQFSPDVTPGRLRSAFQALGFTEMVEVALFADILTMKEAFTFARHIHSQNDFQLASCCCPVWIALVRKSFPQLVSHVPATVSPMIAAGRTVKALHPGALTVFIGPCLAKKAEARDPQLRGVVDWVLTFQEIQDIFQAAEIHPEALPDEERGHASRAGRIYARAGGVSEAVRDTAAHLFPDGSFHINARHADGVPSCKAMIEQLQNGGQTANYYEGMGCVGGCVGGPRAILNREDGQQNVDRYGAQAEYRTPLDNPYVTELLHRLGYETVEALQSGNDIYTREF